MIKLLFILCFNLIFSPLYIASFLLGFILTFIPIFPVRTAQENVKYRLKYTGLKNRLFVTRVFLNYIFYFFEIVFFDMLRMTYFSTPKDFNLENLLKELKETFPEGKERGFTYILGHAANLEFYTLPIIKANKALHQKNLMALAKRSRFELINKILVWHRVRPGLEMLWTDKKLFSNMQAAIERGCSMCLLVDQKPQKNGVFIRFFGEYAVFPIAGLRYCMEKNSIVVYLFSNRIMPGWMNFYAQSGKNQHLTKKEVFAKRSFQDPYADTDKLIPADIFKTASVKEKNANVNLELSCFTKRLEENIKKHPTQWCWDYRKWSREVK